MAIKKLVNPLYIIRIKKHGGGNQFPLDVDYIVDNQYDAQAFCEKYFSSAKSGDGYTVQEGLVRNGLHGVTLLDVTTQYDMGILGLLKAGTVVTAHIKQIAHLTRIEEDDDL